MCTRLALLVALAGALAGFGAHASSASESGKVNGCKLLASAIDQRPQWKARMAGGLHSFGTIGRSQRCEYTSSAIKGVNFQFVVVLYFIDGHTAATAHLSINQLRQQTQQGGSHSVKLVGAGADEAWAVETHSTGITATQVFWRKGRYLGWLNISGPNLTGDVSNAKDLLKAILRGIR